MTLEELGFALQAGRISEIHRRMSWQAFAAVHIEEHLAAGPVHCCLYIAAIVECLGRVGLIE